MCWINPRDRRVDFACACHTNCVLYVAGVQKKLGLKNVGGFAVSQNAGSPQLAAYVPEGKGSPGFVGVWPLAQLSKNETPPPTARRSFFRVISPALWSLRRACLGSAKRLAGYTLCIWDSMHLKNPLA